MENATKGGLFGGNVFTKAFQEFDEESFFEGLHNQVKNKSYFEKYRGFKVTITILSYVFNLGSALTASYAIFWLTQWLTGYAWAGYTLAAICLYFLESIKRKSSTELWQLWFFRKQIGVGWLLLSLACFGASVASSGFGIKQGTEEQAPDPELIKNDSLLTHYNAEIAKLEAKNEDLRNNRNREGITFYKLADGITANELVIADYRKRALDLETKLDGKNEKLTKAYMAEVQLTAWTLVWITVAMEVLFECCIAYIWYFAFRSYVEKSKVEGEAKEEQPSEAPAETPPPSPTPDVDVNALVQQIQTLQGELEALRASQTQNMTLDTPEPILNGTGLKNGDRNPIGFFTAQQRAMMEEDVALSLDTGGQAWTDVDTAVYPSLEDKYTIEHTYTKGGQQKTVHYTLRMVNSRIGQYERGVTEAEQKEMAATIVENRKQWLAYWKGKRTDLLQKMQAE